MISSQSFMEMAFSGPMIIAYVSVVVVIVIAIIIIAIRNESKAPKVVHKVDLSEGVVVSSSNSTATTTAPASVATTPKAVASNTTVTSVATPIVGAPVAKADESEEESEEGRSRFYMLTELDAESGKFQKESGYDNNV
ncbi:MAG: hypothetical protein E7353_10010, partial [Clostridiales bacterium]|nr:hypothetical protein [Clostridiales bacterium]